MDIEDIKTCFRTLNILGVNEVKIPYKEFLLLKEVLKKNTDDGGSWLAREVFVITQICIYGVKILTEDWNDIF